MHKRNIKNGFLLFLAATIWGVAFVSQSKGMEYMGPFTFNGVRSILGAMVLIPVILLRRNGKEESRKIPWKTTVLGGILCGLALTTASMFQQYGILYTTVGKAGFITTLYIIFVPMIGIFMGKKAPWITWVGVLMALFGLYLLCLKGSFHIGIGDSLVFVSAFIFAMHILIIDYFSPKTDGVVLSCLQFLICGVVCMIFAFILEEPHWSQLTSGMIPILYAGIMSCGVAYTLQIVGQKEFHPTAAALILSLESVVSALAGYVAYQVGFLKENQTLTGRQIAGCVIVFVAVILVQLSSENMHIKIKTQKEG